MADRRRLPPGRIHHVAIVVTALEDALSMYRDLLGLPLETIMDIESDHVRIAFLAVGESKVELVEPTDDTTGVARILSKHGEQFHHFCFQDGNLTDELTHLVI